MPSPIPGPPPFATSLLSGLVSTTTQQFGGDKEFLGKIQATGNPLGLGVFTDGTRPAAASHPGAILYNTTVAKIQFSNGSIWASLDAGAGSFVQTTGDTMTGQLNIVGAGIAVDTADNTFIVDATNNRVGLGTATPQFPLEISLPSPSDYSVHITNPSNPGFSAIRFSSHLGTQSLTLGFGNAGSAAPYASKNFLALNGADLIVTGTGDVVTASFKDNGDFFVDTNTLYVDAANNRVGIGTSSPGFPLSVNGIVSSSSGGFRFPDATTQTTAFVPTSYVAKIGDTMSGQLTITGAGLVVDSADNTLVVDATNNRVAIGHNAPTRAFDIRTAHGAEHLVRLRNTDVTGSSGIGFESNSGPERLRVGYANPSFGGALQGLNFIATDSSTDLIIAHSAAEYHRFFAGTGNIAFDSTDNLLFLDTANNRIGILQGTPSTSHILDFNPTLGTNGHIVKLRNNSASGYADIEFYQQGGQFAGAIGWGNGSVTGGGAGNFSINYGTNGLSLRNGTTTHHNFQGSAGNITFDVADNVFHLNATTNQIGINTTTLTGFGGYTHPLVVELGTSGTRSVLIRGGGTISKGISFHDTTNTRTWTWDHRPSGENNRFELWYHNGTSPTRILTTTTDGRLGVGNVTPVVELDVVGSGQFTGGLTVDTDTLLVHAGNNNVGIGGSAASTQKLFVRGFGNTNATVAFRAENSDASHFLQMQDDGAVSASGTITGSNLSGTNTGDVTLAAVGSSPNANGASLSGQALTLQPADGTNPGVLTAGTQTIGGNKTLSGTATFSNPIIHSITTDITAFAGGGQASATQLTTEINNVTTVATNGDSVKLPTAVAGMRIVVFNNGASQVHVFPATGGAIDALGTNNAYGLNAGASREFYAISATQWYSR